MAQQNTINGTIHVKARGVKELTLTNLESWLLDQQFQNRITWENEPREHFSHWITDITDFGNGRFGIVLGGTTETTDLSAELKEMILNLAHKSVVVDDTTHNHVIRIGNTGGDIERFTVKGRLEVVSEKAEFFFPTDNS